MMASPCGLYLDRRRRRHRIGPQLGSGACSSVHVLLLCKNNNNKKKKKKKKNDDDDDDDGKQESENDQEEEEYEDERWVAKVASCGGGGGGGGCLGGGGSVSGDVPNNDAETTAKIKTKAKAKTKPLTAAALKRLEKERTRYANLIYYEHLLYTSHLVSLRGVFIPQLPLGGGGHDNDDDDDVEPSPTMGKMEKEGYQYLVMERMEMPLVEGVLNEFLPPPASVSGGKRKSRGGGGGGNSKNNSPLNQRSHHLDNNDDDDGSSFAALAVRFIDLVEAVHRQGHVIVDIKPDNFMFAFSSSSSKRPPTRRPRPQQRGAGGARAGAGKNPSTSSSSSLASRLRMIDLGLLEHYGTITGHRPNVGIKSVVGTPLYVSRHVHRLSTPSRRDDLEAIGFVLCELLGKLHHQHHRNSSSSTTIPSASEYQLPWAHARSDDEIAGQKEAILGDPSSSFWKALGGKRNKSRTGHSAGGGASAAAGTNAKCLRQYFEYVHKLSFKATPNYDDLRDWVSLLSVNVDIDDDDTSDNTPSPCSSYSFATPRTGRRRGVSGAGAGAATPTKETKDASTMTIKAAPKTTADRGRRTTSTLAPSIERKAAVALTKRRPPAVFVVDEETDDDDDERIGRKEKPAEVGRSPSKVARRSPSLMEVDDNDDKHDDDDDIDDFATARETLGSMADTHGRRAEKSHDVMDWELLASPQAEGAADPCSSSRHEKQDDNNDNDVGDKMITSLRMERATKKKATTTTKTTTATNRNAASPATKGQREQRGLKIYCSKGPHALQSWYLLHGTSSATASIDSSGNVVAVDARGTSESDSAASSSSSSSSPIAALVTLQATNKHFTTVSVKSVLASSSSTSGVVKVRGGTTPLTRGKEAKLFGHDVFQVGPSSFQVIPITANEWNEMEEQQQKQEEEEEEEERRQQQLQHGGGEEEEDEDTMIVNNEGDDEDDDDSDSYREYNPTDENRAPANGTSSSRCQQRRRVTRSMATMMTTTTATSSIGAKKTAPAAASSTTMTKSPTRRRGRQEKIGSCSSRNSRSNRK